MGSESISMTSLTAECQPFGVEPLPGFEDLVHKQCEECELWLANPLGHLQSLVSEPKSLKSRHVEQTVERWNSGAKSGCILCGLVTKLCPDIEQDQNLRHSNLVQFRISPKREDFPHCIRATGYDLRENLRNRLWEVEFYATQDTQNPLPGLPLRRDLALQFGSKQCLNLIQGWLHECKTHHNSQGCSTHNESRLPTRILDIGSINPKLVATSDECGYFVALSHCWGNCTSSIQPPRTLHSNFEEHCKSGVPEACLSPSFRDAIKVSRYLGYSYMWIDSLCIIQDDTEDWERESGLMATVYGNADLVIGATSVADGSFGFLGRRPEYFEGTVNLAARTGPQETSWVVCYRSSLPHNPYTTNREAFRPAMEGPLESRAWAYQERVLARRFVSFGIREVCWECTSGLERECFTSHDCQIHSEILTTRNTVHAPRKYNLKRKMEQDITNTRLLGAWRRNVVEPYSKRQLTKSSDRLVALSAVAFEFSKKLSDQYLAGIWRADLESRGLLWLCIEAKGVIPGAPSWSWASVQGSVSHLHLRKVTLAHCPKVTRVEYLSPPSNPFGHPNFASITFQAKVMDGVKLIRSLVMGDQGRLEMGFKLQLPVGNVLQLHLDADVESVDVLREDGGVEISARRRGEINGRTALGQECFTYEGLHCLYIASRTALVLGLISAQSGTFERLGICVLDKTDPESWKTADVTIC